MSRRLRSSVWPDFMATVGQRFILVALRYRRFRIDLVERKGAKEAKAQRKMCFAAWSLRLCLLCTFASRNDDGCAAKKRQHALLPEIIATHSLDIAGPI